MTLGTAGKMQSWSEKKSQSFKQNESDLLPLRAELFPAEQKQPKPKPVKDYERKNLENLQKMQEKKAKEIEMIEKERRKMMRNREKLKQMILNRAAE